MQKSEWWKDFFSGLTVDMWRQVVTDDQTRSEADFIQKMLQLTPPATILDVPCGLGRLAIELASRGFTMSGVDISVEFLEEARAAANKRPLNVSWQQRDMRDLPWQMSFDGAFCFGNSFGYLDDDGNAQFLDTVYRVLRPDGRFVLDASSVAENVLPRIQEHTEMQVGDILFIEDNHYDHTLSRLDTEYTFVRVDRTEKKFGSHRIYTYRELQRLVSNAGFVNCRTFGAINEEPFRFGAQGLFIVASKKGSSGMHPPAPNTPHYDAPAVDKH
jgi:cyclopropane fatty-acyl-phospholipid synthase-like methyltransferase